MLGTGSSAQAAAQPATATSASPLRHAIVFSFFPPGADLGEVYRIDAGGSVEEPIHDVFDAALLSPDGTQFLDFAPAPNDRGTTGIFNVDGSGYRVLPPVPSLILPGGVWSQGGARIVTEAFDPSDGTSVGLYSRRSSDGGGLIRLTNAGSRRDYPALSWRSRRVAFYPPEAPNETSDSAAQDLLHGGCSRCDLTRLTPPGYTTGVPFSYDSISWAPDGHSVTVVAARGGFWSHTSRSVYIANVDGSTFTRVGPSGDIWEARCGLPMVSGSRSRWPRRRRAAYTNCSSCIQMELACTRSRRARERQGCAASHLGTGQQPAPVHARRGRSARRRSLVDRRRRFEPVQDHAPTGRVSPGPSVDPVGATAGDDK